MKQFCKIQSSSGYCQYKNSLEHQFLELYSWTGDFVLLLRTNINSYDGDRRPININISLQKDIKVKNLQNDVETDNFDHILK